MFDDVNVSYTPHEDHTKNTSSNVKPVIEYSTDIKSDIGVPPLITQLPTKLYDDKTRFLLMSYLRNKDFISIGILFDFARDAFTGNPMPATGCIFNDGKWRWKDDLWLYIRDHDVAVPQEFINDVMKFFNNGGKVSLYPYDGDKIPGYMDDHQDEFARKVS